MKIRKLLLFDQISYTLFLSSWFFLLMFGISYYYEYLTFRTIGVFIISLISITLFFYRFSYLKKLYHRIYHNQTQAKITQLLKTTRKCCLEVEYYDETQNYQAKLYLPKTKQYKRLKENDSIHIVFDPSHHHKIYLYEFLSDVMKER